MHQYMNETIHSRTPINVENEIPSMRPAAPPISDQSLLKLKEKYYGGGQNIAYLEEEGCYFLVLSSKLCTLSCTNVLDQTKK
jgi:hypothetical protein